MTKSVFAADLRVYGDVTSKGDLDVLGHVEGSLSVRALSVTRGATIEGTVRAASAEIGGRVTGLIDCDRVAIDTTGSVEGTVSYKTLSMKVGGGLNAHCAPASPGASLPVAANRPTTEAAPSRESPARSRGRTAEGAVGSAERTPSASPAHATA
uniref:Polymer-forming cytoskeletal protein n=1 Tax=Roseospira marina TaxID=140057 RepID=A0A5M6I8S8_9PROT|nr:polymer-forming cytoskeletal protein [Roseospira marina]KAA5604664.1 hypothetical protein F1188_14720 [Roseospira marina]MBB4315109.1 cytoskeletal protein CcmA (bactofilin family) [Roseospira marina]MBB5088121.1 cytoskeletal protein CcmA (bactofilin family) [Roseospira marina]